MDLVRVSRAVAFGVPLAILVGSVVSPPDPFTQLLSIAVGVVLFVPAAYASVAAGATARTLAVFFGAVLATIVLGVLVLGLVGRPDLGRILVVVAAVVVGAVAATRYG